MSRRRLIGLAIALVVVSAVTYVYVRVNQFQAQTVSIAPWFVSPGDEGRDARDLGVGFAWKDKGYCSGQFSVTAKESPTQIRVGDVVNRLHTGRGCAGLGTNGVWATAELALAAPVGNRSVVRDADGASLPFFALMTTLACADAISTISEPTRGQNEVLNEVVLPNGVLQANPSGESDPTARLFAKAGLVVAANTSFAISVPVDWIGRYTIGWGSPGQRTSKLYVESCPSDSAHRWFVFAGGFWVKDPACVPLQVQSGDVVLTVPIGVGVKCEGEDPFATS